MKRLQTARNRWCRALKRTGLLIRRTIIISMAIIVVPVLMVAIILLMGVCYVIIRPFNYITGAMDIDSGTEWTWNSGDVLFSFIEFFVTGGDGIKKGTGI